MSRAKSVSSGFVVMIEGVVDALEASWSEGRFNVIDEHRGTDAIKLEKWIYGQAFFLLPSIESFDHRLLASRRKRFDSRVKALTS